MTKANVIGVLLKKNMIRKTRALSVAYIRVICWTYQGYMLNLIDNLQKIFPIGNIKSPVGDSIPNRGLGTSESGKAESEDKSPIPDLIKYPQLGI